MVRSARYFEENVKQNASHIAITPKMQASPPALAKMATLRKVRGIFEILSTKKVFDQVLKKVLKAFYLT